MGIPAKEFAFCGNAWYAIEIKIFTASSLLDTVILVSD
jgi:hypothetical protein